MESGRTVKPLPPRNKYNKLVRLPMVVGSEVILYESAKDLKNQVRKR